MRPPLSPAEEAGVRKQFHEVVNMTPRAIAAWLETAESRKVGWRRPGEAETVGRKSARRIIEILQKPVAELSDADHAHMRKVVGYCRRHLAQRPWGDVTHTRWRWSLMNWGHDPLKGRRGGLG